MAKYTEILNQLKEVLGFKKADETEKIEMEKATLQDGSVIYFPTLAVDSEIFLVTPDGDVPLATGDYTTEDGTVISVVDGKITNIVMPEEKPAEVEVEVETEEETMSIQEETDLRITNLETAVTELTEMLTMVLNSFNSQKTEMSTQVKTIEDKLAELANAPADEPLKKTKPVVVEDDKFASKLAARKRLKASLE